MAMLQRLLKYLEDNQVEYTHHTHPTAYTAREVASVEHIPAHRIAKVVVYFTENGYGMAVLPGDSMLDLQNLRTTLGVSRLRLATESELADLFPDCELGAMPPFGNLFDLPVFVDGSLTSEETITFNAGTHRDVVHMKYKDFERLVRPTVMNLARHVAA
ncbi:MAG: YbaK/EbsC family protein [Bryobacterales bacterium]|nr:YbaK/EbsC family protein [Bryobacteraceae bacterium]MDW8354443.1 YbaK/EbsC family protein [Bryobacterales bacterium]